MIVSCEAICQSYLQGHSRLDILNNVSLSLHAGEIVALVGASGSGKSTLLHILGLLEKPTAGRIIIDGYSIDPRHISDAKRTKLRASTIGFVYQFHHLLPQFTAEENVMIPLILNGHTQANALEQARLYLDKVGLSHRLSHFPSQLSGGEAQRVAIARALVHHPKILLADEPTGNLDNDTAHMVFNELLLMIQNEGIAALIATHDQQLAEKMHRVLHLHHKTLDPAILPSYTKDLKK